MNATALALSMACARMLRPRVVYVYHDNQDFAARAFRDALKGDPIELRRAKWYPYE